MSAHTFDREWRAWNATNKRANTNVRDVTTIGELVADSVRPFDLCESFVYRIFSCSFDCFKAHKTAGCAPSERESADKPAPTKSLPRRTLHFTTEDTVSAEQLAKLGKRLQMRLKLETNILADLL